MKKKYKLNKKGKYLLLGILDSLFLLNVPFILKQATNLGNYRYNMTILMIFLIINSITILVIEEK